MNYAFVEFADQRNAEQAIHDMNGRKIFNYVRTTLFTREKEKGGGKHMIHGFLFRL